MCDIMCLCVRALFLIREGGGRYRCDRNNGHPHVKDDMIAVLVLSCKQILPLDVIDCRPFSEPSKTGFVVDCTMLADLKRCVQQYIKLAAIYCCAKQHDGSTRKDL